MRNDLIQQLEDRRMLSATVSGGVLTVEGTSGNDQITVSLSSDGTTLTVSEAKARRFGRSGKATTTTFTLADTPVNSIVVNAGAGNDTVNLRGATRRAELGIAATLNGGDGNDNLRGGSLADALNGGAGDDNLAGGAGNDTVNGGDGDDNLAGGAGDDLLNGDAGDDKIVGGAGIDALNGGADDDLLIGADKDGEADVLDGGADSADTAGGEDDADKAVVDDADTLTNATEATWREVRGGHGHGWGGGHGHGAGRGHGFGARRIR